jgi:hypothetical protein
MKKSKSITNFFLVGFIFLLAFISRLTISPYGNHTDLIINAGWGQWIYENGTKGFYTNNVWIYGWPTQLPLINLIYSYNFVIYQKVLWYISYFSEVIRVHNIFPDYFGWLFGLRDWFGVNLYANTPYTNGLIVSFKIIPVIADLMIAATIYLLGTKATSKMSSLVVASIYLFIPFSWYESSLWGQYDQLAGALVVFSFLLLYVKKYKTFGQLLSPIFFVLALQVKPTNLFVIPLYVFIYLFQKPKLTVVLISFTTAVLATWVCFKPFITGDALVYVTNNILPVVFNNDRYGLVNRAFNFWSVLAPFGGWSTTYKIFGLKALYLGVFFWGLLIFLGIKKYLVKKDIASMLVSLFIVTGGGYQLMTGMVDRYLYTALVAMSFLVLYKRKLFLPWILLVILFSINLFYSWGYPLLGTSETWNNVFLIRLLSFSELAAYFYILSLCLKH